jgi:hypothetical protein
MGRGGSSIRAAKAHACPVPSSIRTFDLPDCLEDAARALALKGDSGERYVTLSPRDGTTTIRGSADLTNTAVLSFLSAGVAGLTASLAGLVKFVQAGSLVGLIVCLAVVPVLYSILRTIFGRISESESARLQQVVEDLARLTEGPENQ